jgi:hypothetical protein
VATETIRNMSKCFRTPAYSDDEQLPPNKKMDRSKITTREAEIGHAFEEGDLEI